MIFSNSGTPPSPSSDNFTVGLVCDEGTALPVLLVPKGSNPKPDTPTPKRSKSSPLDQLHGSSKIDESNSFSGSVLTFSGLTDVVSLSFSNNWVVEDSSATWNRGL